MVTLRPICSIHCGSRSLVGIPYRINVGKKLAEEQVEVFTRSTSTKVDVAVDAVVRYIEKKLARE